MPKPVSTSAHGLSDSDWPCFRQSVPSAPEHPSSLHRIFPAGDYPEIGSRGRWVLLSLTLV